MLLLESGLGSAPDPEAQMALVAEAVRSSLLEGADSAGGPATLREAAERARRALLATFDESVHAMLEERLAPLDHLDALNAPAGERARPSPPARRPYLPRAGPRPADGGRGLHGDRHEMARDGDLVGARRQARNADLGSFEAYLVSAALAVGDTALTTVGLRWDLAEAADERDVDDPDEAVRALASGSRASSDRPRWASCAASSRSTPCRDGDASRADRRLPRDARRPRAADRVVPQRRHLPRPGGSVPGGPGLGLPLCDPRPAYDNVPVVSWLALRARCP